MSKFEIKKGINSVLNSSGKKLVDIDFLGIGGAFDIEEGESSALFKTRSGKFLLIDCGYTTYASLKKKDLIKNIDTIFITHLHSDHFAGISTFIFDNYYLNNKVTTIECTELVSQGIKKFLDICGHPEEQYIIKTENFLFIEEDNLSITKIDTTNYHWPAPDFGNSGLLFHFNTGDDYAVVIYSGDINIPITNLMDRQSYSFVYDNPGNVFIFHDMTSLEHPQNAHCNYALLELVESVFKNLFTYHHGEEHVYKINKINPIIASTSMIIQGTSFVIEEVKGF